MSQHYVTFLLVIFAFYVKCNADSRKENLMCFSAPHGTAGQCSRRLADDALENEALQAKCLQTLLWKRKPDVNLNTSDIDALQHLGRYSSKQRKQKEGTRVRKEYRLLTSDERQRFHAALQKMYESGTVHSFARLHASAVDAHHRGPSFLPWHRVLLVMFEDALRAQDPTVSLPYWDYTLDFNMENPVNSIIWSDEYFGNGAGTVTSGFAANWISTDTNLLERAYGLENSLMSITDSKAVFKACTLKGISRPWALGLPEDLEGFHNGVHAWVGGDMAYPKTTAFDPIFYLHHAYIDFVWQRFRAHQVQDCNVDPHTDYPKIPSEDTHSVLSRMVGFPWFENIDGSHIKWINEEYPYYPPPEYPNCCPGCTDPKPILADDSRRVCVSRSRYSDNIFAGKRAAEPKEKQLLKFGLPPANRGEKFAGPRNDPRTLQSALKDF